MESQVKREYTRDELIDLCERAIVLEKHWMDRDSHSSQKGIGQAWALLKAGCEFKVIIEGELATDDNTVWIEIFSDGFMRFECGDEVGKERETYYIPTLKRITNANGSDWY
jgi:hypothetical protein